METSKRPIPIVSIYRDEPEFQERIDEFVYSISSRLDYVQEAEMEENYSLCGKLMKDLAEDAETLGFQPLLDAACEVIHACDAENDENLLENLRTVMEIVQRIKLGHRSAA
jgi:hypothetical protein